ncbi:hypothetical protein GCM10007063_01560 [Lentibacillus kapialis]|uniref:SGNH hydrolase-type esterase domain-containing protein n=1 Tax=Lentibacillus kapialis TaxID=340214 RepID=A0A917USW8_9BACI|nr:GDSL-type esterase/lipase family protein [Lentibacillus kapialis]GGJ82752.1 hypothetical protein GCM10007063_01560 [Lentibacillus kapialis]
MNKKRYTLIILGILFIGITLFLVVDTPKESINEIAHNTKQQKQAQDNNTGDTGNEKGKTSPNDEQLSSETADEPVASLQDIFSEAVKRTINFFDNRETNITAIGDSLTQGVGDDVVDGGYVGILDNTINRNNQLVTFDNYGKRGNRSDQLLKRLEKPKVAQSVKNADIVLITIGANDIMQVVKENFTDLKINDFSPAKETYKGTLQQIFDKINALNDHAEIYLIGIYNPFMHYFPDIKELSMIVEDWNKTSRSLTEQYDNARFIPIADIFKSGDKKLFAEDNFHPSHQGYQLFARRVLKYLTDQ